MKVIQLMNFFIKNRRNKVSIKSLLMNYGELDDAETADFFLNAK